MQTDVASQTRNEITMPLYDYYCELCRSTEEKLLSRKEADKDEEYKCDRCRTTLVRLVSRASLKFKGDGFYITDYKYKNDPDRSSDD